MLVQKGQYIKIYLDTSRFIYIHQDSFIYFKIYLSIYIKIYLYASRCIYINQNLYIYIYIYRKSVFRFFRSRVLDTLK